MALGIKSAAEIALKWGRVTPQRSQDYQAGITSPKNSWAEKTGAAEGSWAQGVTDAASRGSFGRGVSKAGDAKWKRKTLDLGVQRWPDGVRKSETDFQTGFSPYQQVIAGANLPPRGPKGSPTNNERSRIMAQLLHEAKVRG